jgi:hypothetical protein
MKKEADGRSAICLILRELNVLRKKPIDQHYFQEIISSAFALQCISPTSSPALAVHQK